ncbi:MAG: isoprenylcysteine carboxyl methyltransferase family protein [Neisseria sp.]|nr:isoprenylcysteine carboxyl methyltransferase family protein [Neisseria sp.]
MNITLIFILIFLIRLYSLSISIKNEKRLIAAGARQYGENNSKLLAALHIVYYFAALAEAQIKGVTFDGISALGLGITAFSLLALFYVIRELGSIWTVKIYIHPQHKLNRSWLFRHIRHPNYYLNVIPELIGIGLLCHAWLAMLVLLPLYLMVLAVRIRQEEAAMRDVYRNGKHPG